MEKSWMGIATLALVLAAGVARMLTGNGEIANVLFGAAVGLLGPQPVKKAQ